MPCSDSSSSITILLDHQENFISYEYAKITCGREIQGETRYPQYVKGKSLTDIIDIPYARAAVDLEIEEEEALYILYLEWDALRSAIGLYLGISADDIDTERCLISSIEHTENGIEISEVILPPKNMPKILPCSLGDQQKIS
jgi:hypothetical protein